MGGVNRSQRHLRNNDGGVDSSGWDGQPIDYNPGPALLPPVIDSVVPGSVVNALPFGGAAFQDCLTLSGGPVNPALTEFLYTDYADVGGVSPPAFPGGNWTAYTQDPGDEQMNWDTGGAEAGPLNQPTAAGPYIGASPYNVDFDAPRLDAGGGGRWKRLVITVKNAAGQDSSEVFYQGDAF